MELSGIGYICSAGETFDIVALCVYGDEAYAAELLNANPDLCGKMVFDGGEILKLPVVNGIQTDDQIAPAKTAPWKE